MNEFEPVYRELPNIGQRRLQLIKCLYMYKPPASGAGEPRGLHATWFVRASSNWGTPARGASIARSCMGSAVCAIHNCFN